MESQIPHPDMQNTQDNIASNERLQAPTSDGTVAISEMGVPVVADSASAKARYADLP